MKRFYFAPVIFFILFVIFLIVFELYQGKQNYNNIMVSKSREIVNTVITFRKWAASVKNLYADADKVAPNPYLAWRPDRDVYANDFHLTMVNPSYMTRLVSDLFNSENGIKIRLVGINPQNPYNSATEWQVKAFDSFKEGDPEFFETTKDPLVPMEFKYMSPMYVEKPCLAATPDKVLKRVISSAGSA